MRRKPRILHLATSLLPPAFLLAAEGMAAAQKSFDALIASLTKAATAV